MRANLCSLILVGGLTLAPAARAEAAAPAERREAEAEDEDVVDDEAIAQLAEAPELEAESSEPVYEDEGEGEEEGDAEHRERELRRRARLAKTVERVAVAEPPRVHFDMPLAIACREVASPEFAEANPGLKLVEARFEISSLLVAGKERDLTEYFIRIESPQRSFTVVDYLPKTLHESRHAGPISVQDTDEKNASIGINLAGQYEMITGAGINAGLGKKNISCVKSELLPPLEPPVPP